MVYQFQHKTLGQLGRIVLQDSPDGRSQISSEVAGEPNDPMTEARAQIFEPLSQQLAAALEAEVGKGRRTVVHPLIEKVSPTPPKERITREQVRCPRCGEVAALLILSNHAREVAELEDCAQKMAGIYEDLKCCHLDYWRTCRHAQGRAGCPYSESMADAPSDQIWLDQNVRC